MVNKMKGGLHTRFTSIVSSLQQINVANVTTYNSVP